MLPRRGWSSLACGVLLVPGVAFWNPLPTCGMGVPRPGMNCGRPPPGGMRAGLAEIFWAAWDQELIPRLYGVGCPMRVIGRGLGRGEADAIDLGLAPSQPVTEPLPTI